MPAIKAPTWESMTHMKGRNDLPAALFDAFFGETITDLDELALSIEDAWTLAEWPQRLLDQDTWVEMFNHVGYLHNALRAPSQQPSQPITLYRGSTQELNQNMAWTDDIDQARWFSDRNRGYGFDSYIWTAEVEPFAVLARFESARNESEYVIQADWSDIVKFEEGNLNA
jgi:hypothetical protein